VLATYFAVWGFIIISLSTVTKVTQFANRQNGEFDAGHTRAADYPVIIALFIPDRFTNLNNHQPLKRSEFEAAHSRRLSANHCIVYSRPFY
jgi:hypothetical protein